MKGALAAARTGETVFKPLYRGSGEIYLEPTFGHFWPMQLDNEVFFADQGLFACCEDAVKVEAHKVESFSARMAGGEGRYQTKVSGSGMVVFRVPVPRSEIIELDVPVESAAKLIMTAGMIQPGGNGEQQKRLAAFAETAKAARAVRERAGVE